MTMFHMTNDSHLFWTRERLEKEGAYPSSLGHWRKGKQEWMPLYEGKMVQAFDHRAADVVVNLENVHRPALPEPVDEIGHANTRRVVTPQYWVQTSDLSHFTLTSTVIGFKEITAPTNERSMIAAFLPQAAYGNTIPILYAEDQIRADETCLWLASLNSFVFDFCARSKISRSTLELVYRSATSGSHG